ncbi:MAG: DUF4304 domain-containing protein [Pseudomonadota bacterium]
MKQHGFTSRGNNFYKRHPEGNIGIINFQRNREGLPKFTINLGIYSVVLERYLLAEFNQKKVKEYPLLGDYHWDTRIGSLVPREHPARQKDEFWQKIGDKWWEYDDTTDVDQLFNELKQLIVAFGIPEIDKYITDEQLKKLWFSRTSAGAGGPDSFKYLCILFKYYGEKEQLSIVLNDFGKFMQSHPELTGLKKHYDRFMNEASNKRGLFEEEASATHNQSKKMKP